MKKMFLAVVTSLALCGYGFAQDDEDEYEEEETTEEVKKAPAVEEDEEEEDEAPAPKKEKKKKKKSAAVNAGEGTLGLQLDLVDAIDNAGLQKFYLTYKISPDMELSLIFGLYSHGETTAEANGVEADQEDDYTQIQIGVGFDYFVTQKLLPISIGGEFLFNHWGEDNSQIDINILPGFRANLADNLYLTGKVGLSINYLFSSEDQGGATVDYSRLDFGLKTGCFISWFFL